MSDGRDKELQQLQDELKQGKLSRRGFLDRLAGLGVGFGAAFVLGMRGARANASLGIQVSSTDPALNNILSEGGAGPQGDVSVKDPRVMTAQGILRPPPGEIYRPPPPEYYRYERYTRIYDRAPYYRYERTYARYDRTYGR
jgi:hypothetical protein